MITSGAWVGRCAGLTNYGENFVGTPVPEAKAHPAASATVTKSPLKSSSDAGFGVSRKGAGKRDVITTTYGDLDGTGADPWKLMHKLGFDTGSRGKSA